MANGTRREAPGYAGLSVVIGLISIALGGGYWYWTYAQKRDRDRIRADRLRGPELPQFAPLPAAQAQPPAPPSYPAPQPITTRPAVPPAQAMPVPPPTLAEIKQAQHNLNILSGKKPGETGYVEEIGSAGPKTAAALKAFQASQGIVPTGKLDGQTTSALNLEASRKVYGPSPYFEWARGKPEISFLIAWSPEMHAWYSKDSLGFVVHVPGHSDRNRPPSAEYVATILKDHYGASSKTGKALDTGLYSWECPECAGIA